MNCSRTSMRKDRRAVSPAISTVILTAAGIVMILVAMSYANNILNLKMAENEYSATQQYMQTTAKQMDDVAWTIGRTETVNYAARFGGINLQPAVLNYSFRVHNSTGWDNLTLTVQTGILLFSIPTDTFSRGKSYFERVPSNANDSFLLVDSTAPVSQVLCEQTSNNGSGFVRIALVPTIRMFSSSLNTPSGSTTYYKFYIPTLQNGTSSSQSQSVTLSGNGISQVLKSGIDQVQVVASFPQGSALGFDSSFFKFHSDTVTFNSTSTPKIAANSVIEIYVGTVVVQLG